MSYEVLALKYRPQIFEDCVGQEEVAKTLKNSIKQDRVGHAYLFTGSRGVGKTSLARIFAKALNCPHAVDANPCNECHICKSISKCNCMDVIEFDGASKNKVEDIRELIGNVDYQPVEAKYKVYIIDEVHMVTTAAFNALLKTLEEPPPHVKFIFATTEIQKLPETILSRCQILGFKQIQQADIVRRLEFICQKEAIQHDKEALFFIASKAKGAHRDSQSLLDQTVAYSDNHVTVEAVNQVTGSIGDDELIETIEIIFKCEEATIFTKVKGFIEKGFDLGEISERMMTLLRDIIVLQECGEQATPLLSNSFYADKLLNLSPLVRRDGIQYMIQMLAEVKNKMRFSDVPQILLEMTLLKMAHSADLIALADIARELKSRKPAESSQVTPNETKTQTKNNQSTTSQPMSQNDNPLFRKTSHISEKKEVQISAGTDPKSRLPELKSGFPKVLKELKLKEETFYNILIQNHAEIKELTTQEITISVQSNSPFIVSALDKDERKQLISKIIHQLFQLTLKITFDFSPAEEAKKKSDLSFEKLAAKPIVEPKSIGQKLREEEEKAIQDPGIQKILKELDCEVIHIERNEE